MTACASLAGGAKSQFASDYTCPPERISVVERSEPRVNEHRQPPPEVLADPARLAHFREQERKEDAMEGSGPVTFYEVDGCGHRECFVVVATPRVMTARGRS